MTKRMNDDPEPKTTDLAGQVRYVSSGSAKRPKSLTPDGKPNPEYHRWWRTTEKGKASVKARQKKWNNSEASRIVNRRYSAKNRRQRIDKELKRNDESRKKATMNGLPWGDIEDSYLLDNSGRMTLKTIAEKLGRSIKSCEIRLYRLRQVDRTN